MAVDYCVISIGTLSHNRLWGEGTPVRTSHATTTLVTSDDRVILVDPSLPASVLGARLHERSGKLPQDVTDVFLTTLRPVHRRGLAAFEHARWWVNETELESYRDRIKEVLESAERLGGEDRAVLEADLGLLSRFRPAPERFTEQVQLYPLGGASPGCAGLLLVNPVTAVLIASDAAITREHAIRGMVWEGCTDTEAAMESLEDLLQVADLIIPGHDNIFPSPRGWM